MIDFAYVNYNNLENEHPDLVPLVQPDTLDRMEWELFFHKMPQEQLELLVCLYLGMTPEEIIKALNYPNIARFYNANVKLRTFYRKQKVKFLAYN